MFISQQIKIICRLQNCHLFSTMHLHKTARILAAVIDSQTEYESEAGHYRKCGDISGEERSSKRSLKPSSRSSPRNKRQSGFIQRKAKSRPLGQTWPFPISSYLVAVIISQKHRAVNIDTTSSACYTEPHVGLKITHRYLQFSKDNYPVRT